MSIGTSPNRIDAAAKVSGKARYTEDLPLPGMLHAVMVRSTIAHGYVTALDTEEALSLPGVVAIFTPKDCPDTLFPTAGHPYNLIPEKNDVKDRYLLNEHVRHYGDDVAVVVARDQLTATLAAKKVKVEYRELPVMLTKEQALASDAESIHDTQNGNNTLAHTVFAGKDSAEDAINASDHIFTGSYKTPIIQHCHMESVVSYAYMDDQDHIVIVSSTQIPQIVRRIVGTALDISLSKIRVIKPYLGGGFGNKQDVLVEPMVAFLTTKLGGVPVQMSLTREECFTSTRTRHSFEGDVRLGITNEGMITGLDIKVFSNTGAYASHGHSIASAGGGKTPYLYPGANYRYEATTFYSNLPAAGAMRGYGQPQVTFFLDCLVEEAAYKLGIDPLELRLKNVAKTGDINPLSGKAIPPCGIHQALLDGAKAIGWKEKRTAYANQTGDVRRGVGVSCCSYGSNTYPVSVELAGARLQLNQDGRVTLSAGATEIGQGADTALAQMTATALNIPLESIQVVSNQDTDRTPFDTGAYASRQSYTSSSAITVACRELKDKIFNFASLITGIPYDAMCIKGDSIYGSDGTTKIISLADLALQSYYNIDYGNPIVAEATHKTRVNPPVFCCTFVDLEVDIPLCRVTIKQIINVHDSGIIINPKLATGQVHGGMGMGIGWALYEELLYNDKGKILNDNLLDYKMPTFMDISDLECGFVEVADPSNPFGIRAIGEPPIVTPAPAIRNAVWHATGVKVDEIPITPKTLFRYLEKAGL